MLHTLTIWIAFICEDIDSDGHFKSVSGMLISRGHYAISRNIVGNNTPEYFSKSILIKYILAKRCLSLKRKDVAAE